MLQNAIFMIKTLNKMGIKEIHCRTTQAISGLLLNIVILEVLARPLHRKKGWKGRSTTASV